ncbi:choloylglycine hydrolase family protein [Weissella muntiaci]|uniref:Choloylglycine hydrolase family protein n=1 Tax=Weissella muntiaci TaxID=2508881 RepID=A0A6C2C2P9_9LACO|nr:choloylglycine hydrolase family protein [Weissella muntiaci]TYC47756.1 choloylglycine hydrolase family protein [Weissella muntiaci]
MCTSLSYNDLNSTHFLARTMDFAFELEASPVFLPRNYKWTTYIDKLEQANKFAIMGAGSNEIGGVQLANYMVADAFNEKGLAVAELYFSNEANYDKESSAHKLNLVSEELIMWILGNNASIKELVDSLNQVAVIDSNQGVMKSNQPLHWIISDRTGQTVVIESRDGSLRLEDNPVGVLTNSPDLSWHLKNLSEYPDIQTKPFDDKVYGDWTAKASSMGAGSKGLPGGYLSSQRFIRTVFSKQYMATAVNTEEAINNILHILDNVTKPKDIVLNENDEVDYTQYQGISNLDELAYYFVPYGNRKVYRVKMTTDLIEKSSNTIDFGEMISNSQEYTELN